MQILAATDFSTRSQIALRRAGLLARERDADLILVHVVDDDQPRDLITLETREAQRIVGEQISSIAELQGARCHGLVITGDPFDGILRTAITAQVDLIVMGSHRKQFLRDIFVGTTVERVIRAAPCAVLMANREVEGAYRTALAPVDISEPSAHAIKTGQRLGLLTNVQLTLVHAFLPLGKERMSLAGVPAESVDDYVATERTRAANEITAFLLTNGLGDYQQAMMINEGPPFAVISSAVERLKTDFVVIGTHGRTGISKVLLGSVTEEALRSLDVDILAVPPAR